MGFGMIQVLMAALAGGTGNDMLDYMQVKAYWQGKGVAVTAEAMQAELAPVSKDAIAGLVADLTGKDAAKRTAAAGKLASMGLAVLPQVEKAAEAAQGDPAVAGAIQDLIGKLYSSRLGGAVRRLMAIRALGELKARSALGVLKGLLTSKAPFEAEYAAAAIAAIEGKAYKRGGVAVKTLAGDIWRLPANCGIVGQFTMVPGAPVDVAKLVKGVGQLPNNMTPEQVVTQGTAMLVMAAEMTGNIRFDSVTMGVADNVGNKTGFVVFIARGKYNSKAMKALISDMGRRVKSETVNGYEVILPDNEVALIMPSDDILVFCAGSNRQALPLEELTTAIKTGVGGLKPTSDIGKLIKTVDTTRPLWAAATITDAYRGEGGPMIAAFKTMTLVGKAVKGGQLLTVTGRGTDANAVTAAVNQFNGHITQGQAELERQIQRGGPMSDMMKPMLEFLKSIKANAKGTSAGATATFKGSAMMMAPLMLWGVSAHEMADPPPMNVEDGVRKAPRARRVD